MNREPMNLDSKVVSLYKIQEISVANAQMSPFFYNL